MTDNEKRFLVEALYWYFRNTGRLAESDPMIVHDSILEFCETLEFDIDDCDLGSITTLLEDRVG